MTFIRHLAAAAALAACTAAACAAAPAPFYAEASVGASQLNSDCDGGTQCDDSDLGFRLLGGYRIDDAFGVEAGYLDFGKARESIGRVSAKLQSSGPFVAAVFHTELVPKLDLSARLGGYYGMNKLSVSGCTSSQACDNGTRKDNKIKPYCGVGLYYELLRGLSVGGSLDLSEAELDGDKGHAMLLGAAVRYSF